MTLKKPPIERAVAIGIVTLLFGMIGVKKLYSHLPPDPDKADEIHYSFFEEVGRALGIFRSCSLPQKATCISNLKQIDGAKQQWAIENKQDMDAAPRAADLYGTNLFIKEAPVCPLAGFYYIGRVGENPRCTKANHGHSL